MFGLFDRMFRGHLQPFELEPLYVYMFLNIRTLTETSEYILETIVELEFGKI